MKILINTTSLEGKGGVSNHFKGLNGKFQSNVIFNIIGGRSKTRLFIFGLLLDYMKFILTLLKSKSDIVHLNPSLNKKAMTRDSIFLHIAKLFNKKVIVFIHGWADSYASELNKKPNSYILSSFKKSDGIIVLANQFKKQLKGWGFQCPIFLETTKVDDNLISNFSITQKRYKKQILFLARVEENKGIYVTLDMAKQLPDYEVVIAGTGNELELAKAYAKDKEIKNVTFEGFVSGNAKKGLLETASFFVLPTWHGEGMPTSILEAMAFGLVVLTRPVGGTSDFFDNDKMGLITDSKDATTYSSKIKSIDSGKFDDIKEYNHNYAMKNFLASNVAKRLDAIYENIYKG